MERGMTEGEPFGAGETRSLAGDTERRPGSMTFSSGQVWPVYGEKIVDVPLRELKY